MPGQPLRGNLTVNSQRFNMNEWMVDEVSAKPTTGATAATKASATATKADGVLQIPKEFDLTLNTNVGQVIYDNLKLDNVKGTVGVRDETATLQGLTFNTLGVRLAPTARTAAKT
ncbi:hypothetical protein [Hymenobacter volaticus]|uniref:AsmA family protein n=1 Tax=Hymenobacter volaticus TaxID=2932254 RepID=A0ABY4G6U1_9BACT|nr:hypothetical protein [Hymenobacter volaticus]UOQ66219.1 hypothetical protein MUN86_22445 [Hymenobacter volaticus]